jgi:spermidine/putrescine transport system permease protein
MILPIYNQISRIDKSLLEAASDLGADQVQAFLRVLLPLSMPGVISGISMVFLPAMTNYVVLDMLYNSTYIMGSLIGSYFSAYDWHGGSTISLILLVIICIFTLVVGGDEGEKNVRGGSVL